MGLPPYLLLLAIYLADTGLSTRYTIMATGMTLAIFSVLARLQAVLLAALHGKIDSFHSQTKLQETTPLREIKILKGLVSFMGLELIIKMIFEVWTCRDKWVERRCDISFNNYGKIQKL